MADCRCPYMQTQTDPTHNKQLMGPWISFGTALNSIFSKRLFSSSSSSTPQPQPHRCLLSSHSFPYFMLVAFEGGSILRAFLLLLSSPLLWCLPHERSTKLMILITFCGMRVKDMDSVSRAVLPKFYLENLNLHALEELRSSPIKVVFTTIPKVMVENFLKEYLNVDSVVGIELNIVSQYFTGFMSSETGSGNLTLHDHHHFTFISLTKVKEPYTLMPRDKYPKPLIFHDGRLAFLPTPLAMLSMFIWLPFGILLAFFRIFVGIFLPYKLSILFAVASGVRIRLKGLPLSKTENGKGVLYVCTHRTLLDPVFLSITLGKSLTAVTYSLSKMSEILAPIRTVRLIRDRKRDSETMHKLLSEGDLVVCPEGTTCREPYLLRFSSLFAELTDEIVPVAMNTSVSMFYGTTASGLKCLDSIFFLMNPRPRYEVEILEKVPKEFTCAGGKSSYEVANFIQRELGEALGFECTSLTRRDKYLMLAGNEGFVQEKTTD